VPARQRARDMIFVHPAHPAPTVSRQLAYRLVIPVLTICIYSTLAMLWHWGSRSLYFDALKFLGIDPFRFPFLDIHAVLAAAECQRQGVDVYLSNACDAIGRPHVYSPLWLSVTPAFLGTKATVPVGLSLDLLFILSLVAVLRPRTPQEMLVHGLAVISPMTVYALERANNDLVVFLLILCGGMLFIATRPYRLCCYLLFLVAGVLKYYPLALLVLLARERPRVAVAAVISIGVTLISLSVYFHLELGKALANIPAQPYFSDSFSAENLPFGIGEILAGGFLRTAVDVSLLGALSALVAAQTLRTVTLLDREGLDWNGKEMGWLAIGSTLLTACFFAGQNINYRGVYFLLVVPGLVNLHGSTCQLAVRQFRVRMTMAVLFAMWEEFFRRAVYAVVTLVPSEGMISVEVFFWMGRELVWWWLVAGLAGIVISYLQQLPLARDSYVRYRGCVESLKHIEQKGIAARFARYFS
jgi:hypothetical protein